MSWLFSAELVEAFLVDTSSDGAPSALSNGSPIPQAYCAPDKMTAFSRLSRFGMTYKPLTESRGEELLTLYLAAFPAKTLAQQEKEQVLTASAAVCGEKWRASFTKYDLDSRSWKTHQCSLLGDLEPFLETWPQWGLMRDGECWEQQTLAHHISATESGSSEKLPTPQATDHRSKPTSASWKAKGGMNYSLANPEIQMKWPTPISQDAKHSGYAPSGPGKADKLSYAVVRYPTPKVQDSRHAKMRHLNESDDHWKSNLGEVVSAQVNGGSLNPTWVEWLMGWPLGWTDLNPLEMDKSHCVQQPLGNYLQEK